MLGLIWFYIILGFVFVIIAFKTESSWGFALDLATFLWAMILEKMYF